ncbi:SUMF1/EgtB/PvdO family nonheme iron enzyme [Candidatus Poribacteria bacterium]|nr:SUMF1/EgtB/PvdO family nonheme iron enzyme [Candidatus Poribacteria bacterium]MYK95000.1 SUMF1/EgtB/PvdO family nonheme iron enzyme [Candidatus Poribacteria bacterium]
MKTLLKRNLFFSCLVLLLCFSITALSYGQAVVSIDPAKVASPAAGAQFSVNIKIANGNGVAGYDVTIAFDTTALEYVEIKNADYLPTGAFAAPPQVSGNRVTLAATSVSGAASATSGTLAVLTFKVVAAKASTLQLVEVILSDSAANALAVTKRDSEVVVGASLPTDLNGDGAVNVLDLVRVAQDLGKTGSLASDVTGDGKVNVLDLVRVAQDLGKRVGGGGAVPPTNGGSTTSPPAVDPYKRMELIPAGEFRMGSNEGNNEKPIHSVYVDAFYMDKYEVTNSEYAEFLNAKGKHSDGSITWLDIGADRCRIEYVSRVYRAKAGYENHPVVEVSWYGAMAYSEWKGKRLPTEAEWEKAARGGLSGLKYPWGNAINSTNANYNSHVKDTTAVGKYAANGYGLFDMSGNVWEWCLDEYNGNFYSVSPAQNPLSGANSIQWLLDNYTGVNTSRVLRGGSWPHSAPLVRVANRISNTPTTTSYYYGFRFARAVE